LTRLARGKKKKRSTKKERNQTARSIKNVKGK